MKTPPSVELGGVDIRLRRSGTDTGLMPQRILPKYPPQINRLFLWRRNNVAQQQYPEPESAISGVQR